ncbi:hypothetical protein ACW4FP_19210 (plasmid) [Paenarthrobacter ureafaciens]
MTLAAKLLGHEEATIANLFPLATKSVLEVNAIGKDFDLWLSARAEISERLAVSRDVLLAYGCQEPVGEVRAHFRAQIAWLRQELCISDSKVWSVSDPFPGTPQQRLPTEHAENGGTRLEPVYPRFFFPVVPGRTSDYFRLGLFALAQEIQKTVSVCRMEVPQGVDFANHV